MGVETVFIGAVGDDANGAECKAELEREGITVCFVKKSEPTAYAVITTRTDSENTVSVSTGNEFAGHRKRTLLVVFIAAGRAEAAFAAERRKLKITTVRASKHGAAMRWVATVNHLLDVFDFGFTWM